MERRGQRGDAVEVAAAAELVPTTVGILTVAGMPAEAAIAHVEREVVRGVRGGLVGGTAMARELALLALERAPAPDPPPAMGAASPVPEPDAASLAAPATGVTTRPAPADEAAVVAVERALEALPWPDRLATVAAAALGPSRLGPGRPEVVAAAVGARLPSWEAPPDPDLPSVVDLLAAAVAARTPAPDPQLADRLAAAARPPVPLVLLAAALGAIVLVVAGLALWRPWASQEDASRSDDGMRIRQWVAVLDTGPTPASLAGQAADLGRVVGVYVFTDRWACYDGFPPGTVGDQPWFLGIGAVERSTVEELVTRSGREPLVTSEVFQTCVLPPPDQLPAPAP